MYQSGYIRNLSIKNKIQAITLLISCIVLVLASCAFTYNDVHSFRQKLVDDTYTLAELVAINTNAGLIFDDMRTVAENLAGLKANRYVVDADVFLLEDGRRIYTYSRDGLKEKRRYKTLPEYYFAEVGTHQVLTTLKNHFFRDGHLEVYFPIEVKNEFVGAVRLRVELKELDKRLHQALFIMLVVLIFSVALAFFLSFHLQRLITRPIYDLLCTMKLISKEHNYRLRHSDDSGDEIGELINGFNNMLDQVESRDEELAAANAQISKLNENLEAENLRMGAELDITRRLQQMVLPKPQELSSIKALDISGHMEPASEVGGDYYDVMSHNGRIKISIGDVTGHGLESGVLSLMVQTAIQTLMLNGTNDPDAFLKILNRAIFNNAKRMGSDKNLTLAMLDYQNGVLKFSGQHEELLLIHADGRGVERIDTFDLGFMIGIEPDISHMLANKEIRLSAGDTVVLYTDRITEARNPQGKMYGIQRLCQVLGEHWQSDAKGIKQAVLDDLHNYLDGRCIQDDITLLVLKQRPLTNAEEETQSIAT